VQIEVISKRPTLSLMEYSETRGKEGIELLIDIVYIGHPPI